MEIVRVAEVGRNNLSRQGIIGKKLTRVAPVCHTQDYKTVWAAVSVLAKTIAGMISIVREGSIIGYFSP
ncbi:hypothetical protein FRC03_010473 [Tulasnella sp. 419]|nr:hypothetical protein FRC03_010473 [Tulasnella sp. 419]